jgi:hypothetical protein
MISDGLGAKFKDYDDAQRISLCKVCFLFYFPNQPQKVKYEKTGQDG